MIRVMTIAMVSNDYPGVTHGLLLAPNGLSEVSLRIGREIYVRYEWHSRLRVIFCRGRTCLSASRPFPLKLPTQDD